jgi:hypothetical protein
MVSREFAKKCSREASLRADAMSCPGEYFGVDFPSETRRSIGSTFLFEEKFLDGNCKPCTSLGDSGVCVRYSMGCRLLEPRERSGFSDITTSGKIPGSERKQRACGALPFIESKKRSLFGCVAKDGKETYDEEWSGV